MLDLGRRELGRREPSSAPSVAVSPAGPGLVAVGMATGKDGPYLIGLDGKTLYTFTPD